MDKNELFDLLNRIPFFDSFSFDEKRKLAEIRTNLFVYSEDDFVIRQGELDTAIFILLKGEVSITKNEMPQAEINTLKSGSIFGALPFFTGSPRLTNVVAREEVVVLQFDGFMFSTLDPETLNKFKDEVIKILVNKLEEMNHSVAEIKTRLMNILDGPADDIKTATQETLQEFDKVHRKLEDG